MMFSVVTQHADKQGIHPKFFEHFVDVACQGFSSDPANLHFFQFQKLAKTFSTFDSLFPKYFTLNVEDQGMEYKLI